MADARVWRIAAGVLWASAVCGWGLVVWLLRRTESDAPPVASGPRCVP